MPTRGEQVSIQAKWIHLIRTYIDAPTMEHQLDIQKYWYSGLGFNCHIYSQRTCEGCSFMGGSPSRCILAAREFILTDSAELHLRCIEYYAAVMSSCGKGGDE
jgi:hypothetical protein